MLRGTPGRLSRLGDLERCADYFGVNFNPETFSPYCLRTTRPSARLIECAAGGEADERLLEVADHVWSGLPSGAWALESALGWGTSSGVDALTGMALFLTGELPS